MKVFIHDDDEELACPSTYMSCRCYADVPHTEHVCRCEGSWREVTDGDWEGVPEHARDIIANVAILLWPQGLTYEEAVERANDMTMSAFALMLGPFDDEDDD